MLHFKVLMNYIKKQRSWKIGYVGPILGIPDNITRCSVVALLSSTGGGQRSKWYALPPPLSGNSLIYVTVIKMLTICYEKMALFPGKEKQPLSYHS